MFLRFGSSVPMDASPVLARRPWVTSLAILACLIIFFGLGFANNYRSTETLARWGCLPAPAIWEGAYWGLLSGVFVHFEFWHVAGNLFWLGVLGSRLERAIGPVRFLAFFILAGCVSSAAQLATGTAGIGVSGVLYAMFGFMWLTRRRYPGFAQALGGGIGQMFVLWLLGCLLASRLHLAQVGNGAHFSGLLFGVAVAESFVLGRRPRLARAGLAALVLCSMVPLFWCPWSATWLGYRAYRAHTARRYAEALALCNRALRLDPQNASAYYVRGMSRYGLGDEAQATADVERARKLDPLFNSPKWMLPWLSQQIYRAQMAGRHQEAVALCGRMLRLDPRNAWAYYSRGVSYQVLGEAAKGAADLGRARQLDPRLKTPGREGGRAAR